MKSQWRSFLLAVGFFTRIPVPALPDFKESDLNQAARYFPLVGLLVGLLAAMVWWLAHGLFNPALAVLCSMAATILATGAFHEDGLADSADGLGGGMTRERKLEIMHDSRLGSYGAIALVGILLFKFEALSALAPAILPFALIASHALSRLAAVYVMATANYVRTAGKAKPLATTLTRQDVLCASVFGMLCWLGFALMLGINQSLMAAGYFLLITSLPVLVVWQMWRQTMLRQIQGYTGDTLGATQQLTEVAFYLGLLAWERLA
ncbi:adenosylcobinamide-GDP ribazoletransferase [Methylophilus sp. YYY-1]|uniref:Adenosylcobinamide-GDP ribazoletransferase n=1 Tax=Methylophilus glucosoxydans TaxID=752553 RepID=A0ABW3GEJ0_9PROT|nr:adenosylcobinamide-GDP ribazoletransferase [Methylophilus sp. YYY-1]MDF0379239.1 adenosylcobinamide-GDP ribazoletransferase [Methylophilus sp. YYY-1]